MKLSELAEKINAKLTTGSDIEIVGINSIEAASNSELTYAEDDKNILKLADSQAVAVILSSACDSIDKPQLIVDNIGKAIIDVLNIFAPKLTVPSPGIHSAAVVDQSAKIAPTASIGPRRKYNIEFQCIGISQLRNRQKLRYALRCGNWCKRIRL